MRLVDFWNATRSRIWKHSEPEWHITTIPLTIIRIVLEDAAGWNVGSLANRVSFPYNMDGRNLFPCGISIFVAVGLIFDSPAPNIRRSMRWDRDTMKGMVNPKKILVEKV